MASVCPLLRDGHVKQTGVYYETKPSSSVCLQQDTGGSRVKPRANSPGSRSPKRGWGASRRHDLQPFMLLLQLDECLVFFSQLALKILHFLRRCRGVVATAIRAYRE
jgi:hypothetical protein